MSVETSRIEVVMPAMGDSVAEGTVLEWHKQEGDSIAVDETLVESSTDKVDVELPAAGAGTITEILAEEGETVSVGQVIGRMSASVSAAPSSPASQPAADPAAAPASSGANGANGSSANASPVARRVAAA